MYKITLKNEVTFQTKPGTVTTDTLIIDNVVENAGEVLHIVALVDRAEGLVRYESKCVFSRNTIVLSEPFSGAI